MEQKLENAPRHVAIIMDGNGRWAKKNFLTKSAGHKAGAQNLRKLATDAERLGIKYLTAYAFSTENWKRPQDEVNALMNLAKDFIQQYIDDSKKNDMRITIIGDRSRLDDELKEKIKLVEDLTVNKTGLHILIALNYGGRDDIIRAAKKLSAAILSGEKNIEDITEDVFSSCLDTANIPDPDLLIRTGNEQRVSNFLLWQLSYTEFYYSDRLWPDFNRKDLVSAIEYFNQRNRNFGGRNA